MPEQKKIRGREVDSDILKIATEDDEYITEIVGFFDGGFPRSSDASGPSIGTRARSRIGERATAPLPTLKR